MAEHEDEARAEPVLPTLAVWFACAGVLALIPRQWPSAAIAFAAAAVLALVHRRQRRL